MKKLFYTRHNKLSVNLAALLLRIGFGILMIPTYGYGKLINFSERHESFYDFLGIGSGISMGLAIFAELFCSCLLILGLCTRLATIPLIITMLLVIYIHDWQLFAKMELSPAFLTGYLGILLLGPGKYSLDHYLFRR